MYSTGTAFWKQVAAAQHREINVAGETVADDESVVCAIVEADSADTLTHFSATKEYTIRARIVAAEEDVK
jgi:hypothetical protein